MRILIVSQYFWPENFRINELVSELTARGHEVVVLTGLPNYPSGRVYAEYQRKPDAFGEFSGASIVRVPIVSRGRNRLQLMLNYLSFVISGSIVAPWKLRGRQIDVIFVFLVSPITASLPALLIGRLKSAPVALWVLDLWPDTLTALGVVRSKLVLSCVGRLVSFIYRRSGRIFVQSRAFVANVARYVEDADRIRYLPGWAEQVFEDGLADSGPPAMDSIGRKFKILFAGNIGEAQDFPAILTAIECLRDRPDIHWIIVGDGRAKPYLEKEVEERKLEALVTLMGRRPIEEMPGLFRAADALLVSLKPDPIFSLTIPGKVQSYLAAGVPLLAMLDGEGARVVAEAYAGFVCPAGDGAELARQAVRLAGTPASERGLMGARGRAYALREFNRSDLVSRLEQDLVGLVRNG
ncbi:glycosyltransferase family 4 protein [Bradyrhizobium guangdongense]